MKEVVDDDSIVVHARTASSIGEVSGRYFNIDGVTLDLFGSFPAPYGMMLLRTTRKSPTNQTAFPFKNNWRIGNIQAVPDGTGHWYRVKGQKPRN